jgi:formylglycine-generating enzyme required for sulfatase activity
MLARPKELNGAVSPTLLHTLTPCISTPTFTLSQSLGFCIRRLNLQHYGHSVMSKVFISYRRDDSAGYAHAIHSRLVQHFSKDQVFMDVDTVEPGVDFVRAIEKAVGECDVLIVLIGKRWVGEPGGTSRLDNTKDYVRLEVSTALARDIRVIPVLVDGMTMPNEDSLPSPVQPITRRNAIEISNTRFNYDVEQLVTAVRKVLASSEAKRKPDEDNLRRIEEERSLARQETTKLESGPQKEEGKLKPGTVFRDTLKDGSQGPEMVVIPAGTFQMGDINGDGFKSEQPVHTVRIAKPFAIGRYAVAFEEYGRFASATRRKAPRDEGWGRGQRPVIYVSWNDAVEYTKWLFAQTGKRYRLPSEAEWEYAARSGGKEERWAGTSFEQELGEYAWYRANSGGMTQPVGGKKPNGLGLYDMSGNVWEWIEDCRHNNYNRAPADASAWISGGNCGLRVLRGGSWCNNPGDLRSSYRYRSSVDVRTCATGFRIARNLN